VSTICFCDSYRALKVWKNSSWVASLVARNWMSSMSRRSARRYFSRNASVVPVWMAAIIWFMNFSADM